ncbi:aminopeptidase N-like [Haemaphysalis longicornis]
MSSSMNTATSSNQAGQPWRSRAPHPSRPYPGGRPDVSSTSSGVTASTGSGAPGQSSLEEDSWSRTALVLGMVVLVAALGIIWLVFGGVSSMKTSAAVNPLPPATPSAAVRKPFRPQPPARRDDFPSHPPLRRFPAAEMPKPFPLNTPPAPAPHSEPPPPVVTPSTIPPRPVGEGGVHPHAFVNPEGPPSPVKGPPQRPSEDQLPPPRSDFIEKLPPYVEPVHYDLMIKVVTDSNRYPNLALGDTYYLGKVIVELHCLQPTQALYLHAFGFSIKEQQTTLIREFDKSYLGISRMAINDDLEMLKIETDTPLERHVTYTLSIEFAGSIKSATRGIFKTHFVTENERVMVISTQFLPTYARKVFPCFDEPGYRTTFDLAVVRPRKFRTFSNMPLARSEERSKDFVADYFERTPKMATHNLVFVTGPYVTAGTGLVKVHGMTKHARNSDYMVEAAPKIIRYCQETFGIDYPFPKLDFVALPTLPAAAMEQWGLVTFQDTYLIYQPDETPFQMKVDALKVMTNKVLQQWMGNLVTIAWWDDVWLKEGISRYLMYTAASNADPRTEASTTILENDAHQAMELDAFNSSHPVSRPLNTSMQIRKHLDLLTVSKSAALVRMMAHMVPSTVFRLALVEFFKKYSYQSVGPQHFYKEIHTAQKAMYNTVKVNFTETMDEWTHKAGVPLLTVMRSYLNNSFRVRQRQFFFSGEPPTSPIWQIPISFVTEDNPDFTATGPKHWLSESEAVIFGGPKENHWLILNAQQAYYYKVNYDKSNWLLIVGQLQTDHKVIHEFNRAQLIDDALDLARAGQLEYNLAFEVLEYLPRERHHVPWRAAVTNFHKLDPVLRHTRTYPKWKRFVNHLLTNQYERLMSEESKEESMQISLLRSALLTLSCDYDHQPCVNFSRRMLENLKTNYDAAFHLVPYSYRPLVLCQAIKHGPDDDFHFLWKRYEMSTSGQERAILLKALSCTANLKLLEKLLLVLVNKNGGGAESSQKAANLLNAISSTSLAGSSSIVRFMAGHHDAMFSRYGALHGVFDSVLQTVVDNIRHENELHKLHEIYERTRDVLPSEEEKVLRMIHRAKEHIRWTSKYYRSVDVYLEHRFGPNSRKERSH